MGRGLAFIVAVVAIASLLLQLSLLIHKMDADGVSMAGAAWRFLGFFTILSNILVAVVATAMALAPASPLTGPRVRFGTAVAIAVVGIVYSLALRNVWDPEGWQAVADHALHDAIPVLFLLAWLAARHGELTWSDVRWAIAVPLLYVVYSLMRGAIDGWYPYWFFDPSALGIGQLTGNFVLLLAAFLLIGLILIAIDRSIASRWPGSRA